MPDEASAVLRPALGKNNEEKSELLSPVVPLASCRPGHHGQDGERNAAIQFFLEQSNNIALPQNQD
jgi:hypothetical protein